jgi:8-oxo-dGTP pyrophosphatase MutT (NUDIX family)
MAEAALGIIYNNTRDQVLLIQRRDVPIWVLPGGGIDPGETAKQAVVREVHEETGLDVAPASSPARFLPINRFTQTAHVFECEVIGGQLQPGDEARAARFFALDQLPEHLFHYHREWLHDVRQTTGHPLTKPMSRRTFRAIILFYCLHPLWGLRYLLTRLRQQ